jgi:hypothetical protein
MVIPRAHDKNSKHVYSISMILYLPMSGEKGLCVNFEHFLIYFHNLMSVATHFRISKIKKIFLLFFFYLNLCALQLLFNKVLYQNASTRNIQHIWPFAQSAHATIFSAITQPRAQQFFLRSRNLSQRSNVSIESQVKGCVIYN